VIGVTAASSHMEKVVAEVEVEVAAVGEEEGEVVLGVVVVAVDLEAVVGVVAAAFASPFRRDLVREGRNAGLRTKKASS